MTWRHLEFHNRLGVAGGVDKNGINIVDWWTWGPGFIEIGTVTPKPQLPNEGQIIGRNFNKKIVWNKMGFPNDGADIIYKRLNQIRTPHFTPIFLNIGKNRNTSLEEAHKDYVTLIERFRNTVDAFVINISSPNTEGLRELFNTTYFENFLGHIKNAIDSGKYDLNPPPCLLKLSPDMSIEDLRFCLETSVKMGLDGWVMTNTTTQRDGKSEFPNKGGLSGQVLSKISRQRLRDSMDLLGSNRKDKLIVSVGGVMEPEDVFERIEIGADLVQVYSTIIFEGPWFFEKVFNESSLYYALKGEL